MKDELNSHTATEGLTLVLGGTGKTGRRVVQRLASRGVPTRVASRSANPSFDWNDQSSWDAVLDGVTAVYVSYAPDLAIPGATDTIRGFVGRAVEKGVQRLVLLSGRGEEGLRCAKALSRVRASNGPSFAPAGSIRISPKGSFSTWY